MTNSKKLYQIISNVMDMPLSEISDSLGPNNIENWDSFNALLLVDELETEFKYMQQCYYIQVPRNLTSSQINIYN
mgnify:CR=1 FL=1